VVRQLLCVSRPTRPYLQVHAVKPLPTQGVGFGPEGVDEGDRDGILYHEALDVVNRGGTLVKVGQSLLFNDHVVEFRVRIADLVDLACGTEEIHQPLTDIGASAVDMLSHTDDVTLLAKIVWYPSGRVVHTVQYNVHPAGLKH